MKVYQTKEIRNIAILGAAKSGKTTLAEDMLFEGGVINRRGSIEDKNTVSDYRDIELERQNSIYSTVLYAELNGKKINMIDCPGFDDFVGEVLAALKVTDTALMLINAQNGVEVGAEINFRNASKANMPLIFVINHLEHENSNFEETIRQMRQSFRGGVMICQYPVNEGPGFDAVIDLLQMKMLKFNTSGNTEVLEIPASEKAKADELYAAMVEELAANEESLMEKFFENGSLSEEEISEGLKIGLINRGIFPVFCVHAKQNWGVRRLMEFIVNTVPSPDEAPRAKTVDGKEVTYNPADPACAFVFKTIMEPHLGEMSFFKVYAGEITEAMDVVDAENGSKERLTQLFIVAGRNRQKIEKVMPGDIAASIKLKNVRTNHTLNSPKAPDVKIEPIVFPASKISFAIKAKNSADDEKLMGILNDLAKIDPTLVVEQSKELRQLIVGGQGELHLNIQKWLIENVYKIPIDFLPPRIPYRETITKPAKAMYRHKKQSGGAGQFGEVHMMIEPYYEGMPNQTEFPVRSQEVYELEWGGKLIFNNCIVGGAIDARFMPAILKGIMEKMEQGPLTGSYARDIVVNIYDGKMHPVDSNEISFKLAGRNAFKEAFKNAGPKILEPIYEVEVLLPEDKFGDVMTDLQARRAIILGMDSEGNYKKIIARVPLAEMNRYSTALSSITSGRATYSLKFIEYAQVPPDVQTTLLKAYEEQEAEE
ncbi:MAG: Translation elongation factor G [Bacteroidetes bacterium 38_7]|nr:MAG: Translation elongation factor G [Bacteroidetes bacterium 38_7]HAL65073.1 elongation factor G [Bacteroidales bacterium]